MGRGYPSAATGGARERIDEHEGDEAATALPDAAAVPPRRSDEPGGLVSALSRNRKDLLVGLLVAVAGFALPVLMTAAFGRLHWDRGDFWFDADVRRIAETMTIRDFPALHSNIHPAFALFFNPLLALLVPLSRVNRILLAISFVSAGWTVLVYAVLRTIGVRILDAALFAALALVSAASMFFTTVPETFPTGAFTMLIVVFVVAWEAHHKVSTAAYIAAGAVSMGVTVTNGMVVVLAALGQHRRRAMAVVGGSIVAVILLSLAQHLVFPQSQFVLDPRPPAGAKAFKESDWILSSRSGGPVWVTNSVFLSTIVMPELGTKTKPATGEVIMSVQRSAPGTGSPAGAVAAGAWVALLALGVVTLVKFRPASKKFRFVVGLSLLGQFGLHLVYGQEIFPYSMHFLPFLVIVAALATLGPWRRPALALAVVVVVGAAANNLLQIDRAHELFTHLVATTAGAGG